VPPAPVVPQVLPPAGLVGAPAALVPTPVVPHVLAVPQVLPPAGLVVAPDALVLAPVVALLEVGPPPFMCRLSWH